MNKATERAIKQAQRQASNDIRAVLAHAPTMRFLLRTFDDCGVFRDQKASADSDTNYNLGKRRAALDIIDRLQEVDGAAMLKLLTLAETERQALKPAPYEGENDDDQE